MRDWCEWMGYVALPTCVFYLIITLAVLWICGVL
jgi:hypothetical protein